MAYGVTLLDKNVSELSSLVKAGGRRGGGGRGRGGLNIWHEIKVAVSDFGDQICVKSRQSGRGYRTYH